MKRRDRLARQNHIQTHEQIEDKSLFKLPEWIFGVSREQLPSGTVAVFEIIRRQERNIIRFSCNDVPYVWYKYDDTIPRHILRCPRLDGGKNCFQTSNV